MANNKKQQIQINCICSFILALVLSLLCSGVSAIKAADTPTLKYSTLHRDPVNGSVIFLSDANLSEALEQTSDFQKRVQADVIALAYLQAYSTFFKLTDPARELVVKQIQRDNLGYQHVRFRQQYQSIPVQDAELVVHLDPSNHIYLVNGDYQPTPLNVNIAPKISVQQAIKQATETFKPVPDCRKFRADLVIFVVDKQTPRLAYQVHIVINLANAWQLIIDAETGQVLAKVSNVQTGQGTTFNHR